MLTSLNRPGAIPALFTTADLSLQFFRENAFVATLDDNDKDSLLSGLNIRKRESSVKGKDVKEIDHKIWAPFFSRPGGQPDRQLPRPACSGIGGEFRKKLSQWGKGNPQ